MRIAKFISNSGYCSRREAEKLIINHHVKINDKLCLHPSDKVKINDHVKVRNKNIKLNKSIKLWKMYKPIKFICSNKDNKNRKIVFELIPQHLPRLISIGRLDFMSEGLLLFTNNGDFARKLELPNSNFLRVYRVCLRGNVNNIDIKNINKGLIIKKINYNKIQINIEKKTKSFTWLIVKLKEGKNREIRNICEYYSWNIVKLIRIQYGPYKLSDLKKGQMKEINKIY